MVLHLWTKLAQVAEWRLEAARGGGVRVFFFFFFFFFIRWNGGVLLIGRWFLIDKEFVCLFYYYYFFSFLGYCIDCRKFRNLWALLIEILKSQAGHDLSGPPSFVSVDKPKYLSWLMTGGGLIGHHYVSIILCHCSKWVKW